MKEGEGGRRREKEGKGGRRKDKGEKEGEGGRKKGKGGRTRVNKCQTCPFLLLPVCPD